MANQITIYASQSVDFTDTTYGGVTPYIVYHWVFTTGSGIIQTYGPTANIQYTSPGLYNAYLSITDFNNVIDYAYYVNLINVLPSTITASFTKSDTAIIMSETINFTDASTGDFASPDTWSWDIGGSGSTSQNVTNFELSDWVDVQGADIADPPGYSRQVTVQLTAENGLIHDTTSDNFTMSKIGVAETVYINTDGIANTYIQASSVTLSAFKGSDASLPLNNKIFEIGVGASGGAAQVISNFHSTNEDCTLVATGLAGDSTFEDGIEEISGVIGINNILYSPGETAIDSGDYLTPGLKNNIFYMDTGNITILADSFNWSDALLTSVISSPYPLVHSAQAYARGGEYQENPDDNTTSNPLIVSPQYFTDAGFPGNKYTLTLEVTQSSGVDNPSIDFDANGGTGNSSNGTFYKMQNTADNPAGATGIAEMINTAIAIGVTGGTGYVEAVASDLYLAHRGGTGSYYGIAIMIKNSKVTSIELTDNSNVLNDLGGPIEIVPFAATIGSYNSCTGVAQTLDLSTSGYYAGYGTKITYGGSIYK